MTDNKITMPSGGAGITRYFDESKSKIKLNPRWVILSAIVVIAMVLVLHAIGEI